MRLVPPLSSSVTMSKRRQRLLSMVIGLVLALAQVACLYLAPTYFQVYDIPTMIGLWALIAFVVAIPPGFSIARYTGKRSEGMAAGRRIGCTAALLTMLVEVVALLISLSSARGNHLAVLIIGFILAVGINIIGITAAFAGAFIGSRFGASPPV